MRNLHERGAEKEAAIDPSIVKRLFFIDPSESASQLRWRETRGKVKAGSAAGSMGSAGYRRVKINGAEWKEHRLIFAYYHGRWPKGQIDHIDGDKANNAIENLREVSASDNQKNKTMHRNNTSGHMGVVWRRNRSKWVAEIMVERKRLFLGYFGTFSEAVAARRKAEVDCGFHPNHGKLANEK
jgi:hypothetical protein